MRYLAALLVLAACAKSATELAPFPCAADSTCPAGLACAAGQCAPAVLDATCTTGDDPTDCAAAAPNAVCTAGSGAGVRTGACEIPCSPACPSGKACTASLPGGFCLTDCSGPSTSCPAGTTCYSRGFDAIKICVPPGMHCQQVTSPVRCSAQLCEANAFGVTCPNGTSSCPLRSTCNATSTTCQCEGDLKAFDCADQPCNGACTGRWWCAPDVTRVGCFTDLRGVSAICKCYNGTQVLANCNAEGKTCDDLCAGR